MALKGRGKVYRFDGKCLIYVPKDVSVDSSFPFKEGEEVEIEIRENYILVRRVRQ